MLDLPAWHIKLEGLGKNRWPRVAEQCSCPALGQGVPVPVDGCHPQGTKGESPALRRSFAWPGCRRSVFLIQKGLAISSGGKSHPELNCMEAWEIAGYIWKYLLHIYIPLKKYVRDAISINTNKAVWFQFSGKINILLSIISVTFNALVYHPLRLISIIAVLKQQ